LRFSDKIGFELARLLKILEKKGYKRKKSETLREIAERLPDYLSEFSILIEVFEKTRYGERRLTSSEIEKVSKVARSLKTKLVEK